MNGAGLSGWLTPDWPAPARVRALCTTRAGGVSGGPWAGLNLAAHVGDDPLAVTANRAVLRPQLPDNPLWLTQVHGTRVVDPSTAREPVEADAACTRNANVPCAVMTADCLPVLLCDDTASVVAAAHAGWRGLAAGVLESTVAAMGVDPATLRVWIGPAIGPDAFECGADVLDAFSAADADAATAFVRCGEDTWRGDLPQLAQRRLVASGLRADHVHLSHLCTVTDPIRFYSYRRDGVTGRIASVIWLSD